jgi:hypothetical protein
MGFFSTCDTHGLTRAVTGIYLEWNRCHRITENRSRPSLDRLLLFPPLGGRFALTDYRGGRPTPPDLGFATRSSSVPAIL